MFAAVGWPFLELKEGRSLVLALPAMVPLSYFDTLQYSEQLEDVSS